MCQGYGIAFSHLMRDLSYQTSGANVVTHICKKEVGTDHFEGNFLALVSKTTPTERKSSLCDHSSV